MHAISILSIIFGGLIIALAIIASTSLGAIRIIRGGVSRKSRKLEADEAGMIQELYQGLSKMEGRVEALETLLLDRERKDRQK